MSHERSGRKARRSRAGSRRGASLLAGAAATLFGASMSLAPSGCFLSVDGYGGGGAPATTSTASTGGMATSSTASTTSTGAMTCTFSDECGKSPCVSYSCDFGVCHQQLAAAGQPCTLQQGVCDGMGACVTCVSAPVQAGCAKGEYCFAGSCASCSDKKVNGDETDVDCGGSSCPKCVLDQKCNSGSDCASGTCAGGTCTGCGDGIKNGDEIDVDCGGSCPPCGNGKSCNADADCVNGHCVDKVCCESICGTTCSSCAVPGALGTCALIPAGWDLGASCGPMKVCDGMGACQALASKKPVGAKCANSGDCFNGTCAGGYCKFKIGDPCGWDMECGSGLCAQGKCKACAGDADCSTTHACASGVCKLPYGDLCGQTSDCVGPTCYFNYCLKGLAPGQPCGDQAECQTHLCKAGVCASCTTADCASCKGGFCLLPSGAACQSNADCDSGVCAGSPFQRCE